MTQPEPATPSVAQRARARSERVVPEASRFLVVGGVATVVALAIFNLLVHGYSPGPGLMADDPLEAYVLANSVGMVISWYGTRLWAFRDRPAVGIGGGFPAYVLINLASMTIPLACLAVSRYALGLTDPVADNVAANVIGLALGMAARFWAVRWSIFPEVATGGSAPRREASHRYCSARA